MSEDNKLVKIGEEYGLEENKVQTLMQSYGGYFSEAKELVQGAMDIKVKDENDFENMEKAREKRLALKKVRVGVDNIRKQLKEQSLREGRAIDGMANIIKAIVEPVEEYLTGQEKYAEELAKEKKLKVEQERINKLSKFVSNIDVYKLHPDTMDSQTFEALLKNSEIAYNAQEQAKKEAEEARKKEEEAKKAEGERIRAENEKLKELSNKKNQLIKLGVTDTKLLDSVADMSVEEFEKLVKEKQIEFDAAQKLRAKEIEEKAALELKLKEREEAENKARAKAEQEELASKELERQNALAPDKEKILALADQIASIETPPVKDERAMKILVNFREGLKNVENELRESVKEL